MPYMMIRHKVKDFSAWKTVFEEHGGTRAAAGSKGGYLLRNQDDPSETVILLEVDDTAGFREMVASADLRDAMQRVGVADQPDFYFLDEDSRPTQ